MGMLNAGGVELPAPITMSVSDEIIWSEDTGRTLSGGMVGDVIATKQTISVVWGILSGPDVATIKRAMPAGFFDFTFRAAGGNITIPVYRGAIKDDAIGMLGDGIMWYRSVSVELIQK